MYLFKILFLPDPRTLSAAEGRLKQRDRYGAATMLYYVRVGQITKIGYCPF